MCPITVHSLTISKIHTTLYILKYKRFSIETFKRSKEEIKIKKVRVFHSVSVFDKKTSTRLHCQHTFDGWCFIEFRLYRGGQILLVEEVGVLGENHRPCQHTISLTAPI